MRDFFVATEPDVIHVQERQAPAADGDRTTNCGPMAGLLEQRMGER